MQRVEAVSLQQKQQRRDVFLEKLTDKCYQQDVSWQLLWDMRGSPGNSRNTWMDFWRRDWKVWGTVVLKMKAAGQQNPMINVNTTWLVTTEIHILRLIELHLVLVSHKPCEHIIPCEVSLPFHTRGSWGSEEICYSAWSILWNQRNFKPIPWISLLF